MPPQFRQTGLITATQEEVTDPTPLPLIPLPPLPDHENVQLHEEVVPAINSNTRSGKNGSEMSPVSDTELAEIRSPKSPIQDLSVAKEDNDHDVSGLTPPLPLDIPAQEPPLPPELSKRPDVTPPPPPPDQNSPYKPPSPLTSPIGSSPDDIEQQSEEPAKTCSSLSVMASDLRTPRQMMQSQFKRAVVSGSSRTLGAGDTRSSVSASDISDTDLPEATVGTMSEDNIHEGIYKKTKNANVPEDDLEALEQAKAELQAKLAATNIRDDDEGDELVSPMDDSDGEVHTDDSNDYMKRFREIASGGDLKPKTVDSSDDTITSKKVSENPPQEDSSMSPISSEGPTPEPPNIEKEDSENNEVKDDHSIEKIRYSKKDGHDDDDEQPGSTKQPLIQIHSSSTRRISPSDESVQNTSKSSGVSETHGDKKEKQHSSSSSRHSHSSHGHHRYLFTNMPYLPHFSPCHLIN